MMKIPLTNGLSTIVDDEDYDILSKFKWYAHKNRNTYYAKRAVYHHGKKTIVGMHTAILKPRKEFQCDHIDGNGLNNQRENLRAATTRQNQQNRHIKKTSKYPGVFWHKARGNWNARIRVGPRRINIGSFKNETDAANAYMVYSNIVEYSKTHIVGGCCND